MSALGQTWPNKEIIVVNDGSRDRTLEIARRFESKILKVINQENKGGSAARNMAYEYAQGDYVQWLDADDLLAPNKIYSQMKETDGDFDSMILYCCPYRIFYWRIEKAKLIPNALWQDLTPIEWMLKALNQSLWIHPAAWLSSRRLIEKAGPWDTRLSLNDDGEYFFRVAGASKGIKFVRESECYYRESGFGQASKKRSQKASQSFFLSTELCIKYIRSLEDSDRTRRACLNFIQRNYIVVYPDYPELIKGFKKIALELGGQLEKPQVEWKLGILRRLFGLKTGKKIHRIGRKLRLFILIRIDKVFDYISKLPIRIKRDENLLKN
jgi:glycosyltransferase involved in cell wall biosynthesis